MLKRVDVSIARRASYRRAAPAVERIVLVQMAVAEMTGVGLAEIGSGQRGDARTARARQMAMYLSLTMFGIPASRLAVMFGRDRATVRHAVRRVEELREDREFDRVLSLIETTLARAGRPA